MPRLTSRLAIELLLERMREEKNPILASTGFYTCVRCKMTRLMNKEVYVCDECLGDFHE